MMHVDVFSAWECDEINIVDGVWDRMMPPCIVTLALVIVHIIQLHAVNVYSRKV